MKLYDHDQFGMLYERISLFDVIQLIKLSHKVLFALKAFTSPTIMSPLSAWSNDEVTFLPNSISFCFYELLFLDKFDTPSDASTMIRSFLFHTEPFKGLMRRWKMICHWRGWILSLSKTLTKCLWSTGMRLESTQQQVIC